MKAETAYPSSDSLTIETHGPDQTFAFGKAIGRLLKPGMTLFLRGDLGSGKTVFAKGLARGLDVPPVFAVTSPTYTLINAYPGRIPFYHADLYRLSAPVDPDEIGLGELFDSDGSVAVEWPERLDPSDYPAAHMDFVFTGSGDDGRKITMVPYGLAAVDLLKTVPVSFFS